MGAVFLFFFSCGPPFGSTLALRDSFPFTRQHLSPALGTRPSYAAFLLLSSIVFFSSNQTCVFRVLQATPVQCFFRTARDLSSLHPVLRFLSWSACFLCYLNRFSRPVRRIFFHSPLLNTQLKIWLLPRPPVFLASLLLPGPTSLPFPWTMPAVTVYFLRSARSFPQQPPLFAPPPKPLCVRCTTESQRERQSAFPFLFCPCAKNSDRYITSFSPPRREFDPRFFTSSSETLFLFPLSCEQCCFPIGRDFPPPNIFPFLGYSLNPFV